MFSHARKTKTLMRMHTKLAYLNSELLPQAIQADFCVASFET